jgi:hypothetical protein
MCRRRFYEQFSTIRIQGGVVEYSSSFLDILLFIKNVFISGR